MRKSPSGGVVQTVQEPAARRRPVAVVELGTTSVRMLVAELGDRMPVRVLDSLQQPVALGRDSFSRGYIERSTIESCVKTLRDFRRVLEEYGIVSESDIRAVATSAVREASNRDAFLDRVYIATGIPVRVIDQAEINRYTYHAVRPILEGEAFWRHSDSLVIEVGGGSTEALLFRRGRVAAAHMYRFGSLRLRKMLDDYRVSTDRQSRVLLGHADQVTGQILDSLGKLRKPTVLALGPDARFACAWLNPGWDRKELARIPVSGLNRLARDVMNRSADELVRQYEMTYPDAETVAPALQTYARLARALELQHLYVCDTSLRNGVLNEMASGDEWTEEFRAQIVNSALELARRYNVDLEHASFVAEVSSRLFAALQGEHRLPPRYGVLLHVAALLHECGHYITRSAHHKHSLYIILHSDLFGLSSDDLLITALVARYHRRAHPNPIHEYYTSLDRDDRIRVSKLAAILRVADAMDTGQAHHRLPDLEVRIAGNQLALCGRRRQDFTLERLRLREKAQFFEQVYGLQVVLEDRA